MNKDDKNALKGWVKVFSTRQVFRAEAVKATLIWNQVGAVIINKMDSSYNDFGEREVYVENENLERAKQIIADEIQFEE